MNPFFFFSVVMRARNPLNYGRNKSDIRKKTPSTSLNSKIRFKLAGEALQSLSLEVVST